MAETMADSHEGVIKNNKLMIGSCKIDKAIDCQKGRLIYTQNEICIIKYF